MLTIQGLAALARASELPTIIPRYRIEGEWLALRDCISLPCDRCGKELAKVCLYESGEIGVWRDCRHTWERISLYDFALWCANCRRERTPDVDLEPFSPDPAKDPRAAPCPQGFAGETSGEISALIPGSVAMAFARCEDICETKEVGK